MNIVITTVKRRQPVFNLFSMNNCNQASWEGASTRLAQKYIVIYIVKLESQEAMLESFFILHVPTGKSINYFQCKKGQSRSPVQEHCHAQFILAEIAESSKVTMHVKFNLDSLPRISATFCLLNSRYLGFNGLAI